MKRWKLSQPNWKRLENIYISNKRHFLSFHTKCRNAFSDQSFVKNQFKTSAATYLMKMNFRCKQFNRCKIKTNAPTTTTLVMTANIKKSGLYVHKWPPKLRTFINNNVNQYILQCIYVKISWNSSRKNKSSNKEVKLTL